LIVELLLDLSSKFMIVLCLLKSIPPFEVVSQNSISECTGVIGGGGFTGPGPDLSLLQDKSRLKVRVISMDLKDKMYLNVDIIISLRRGIKVTKYSKYSLYKDTLN
jgi:hypothetical protein